MPHGERIFNAILAGLFSERLVASGTVLDAGANLGYLSCFFASISPDRTVHGIEPVASNVAHIKKRFGMISNLRILHAGLGGVEETLAADTSTGVASMANADWFKQRRNQNSTSSAGGLKVHSIDSLYSPSGLFAGERLAFASIDVEGSEMDVLRGATVTLRRDMPILTLELYPATRHAVDIPLLEMTYSLGYDAFIVLAGPGLIHRATAHATASVPASHRARACVCTAVCVVQVDEGCGYQFDCRNAIFLPRGRMADFYESPALDLAAATGRLLAVNSTSLRKLSAARKFSEFSDFRAPRIHRMYGEGNPNFEAIAQAHASRDILAPFQPTRMIWPEALPTV